jgi:hypothetical protein
LDKIFLIVISLVVLTINGCSQNEAYGSEKAIKKGDVVYLNEVFNIEKFNKFLVNLSNNKKDSIRITAYTDEGDPTFKDLKYDGTEIKYSYDDSNDKFGGNKKGLKRDVCSKISEEENLEGNIDYILGGCEKKSPDISYFLLRVPK